VRKYLIILAFVLLHIGCVETIYAQTFPMTLTVTWDANSVAEGVTGYELSIDSVAATGVTGTTGTVVVNTLGHHVIHVVAVNVTLTCDVSSQCSSGTISKSAPADLGFTVNAAPTKPNNPKLSKP
jgi:hypothetical protein